MSNQTRIDIHLMEELPQISRSYIKKLIIDGVILVNGQKVMPNYRLNGSEDISYKQNEIDKYLKQENASLIKPYKILLDILYEDENIILVNKPAKLNSHPVLKNVHKSLLNALQYHIQKRSEFAKNVKLRLVHRLDRDTSGVVLATKNLESHNYYSELFEKRKVIKEYLAVVKGDLSQYLKINGENEIDLSTYIAKDPKGGQQFVNTSSKKGKLAKSRILFTKYFNKFGKHAFSLVKIIPETGRTHQIRVHLSSIGFPILGDKLYGGQKYKRVMLHAHALSLRLQKENKMRTFVAEPPREFIG